MQYLTGQINMYKLFSIYEADQLAEHHDSLVDFCKRAEAEANPASKNMSIDDWENRPETLMYLLYKEGRFWNGKGVCNFLYYNSDCIGFSGAYISDFSKSVVIGGVRSYLLDGHKNKYLWAEYCLPSQMRFAYRACAGYFLLTFNEYNKNIANIFLRAGKGKGSGLGTKRHVHPGQFSSDIKLWPKRLIIKNTPQWALVKQIDFMHNYDFSQIEETVHETAVD
jgi:hypothetical protein